MTPTRSITLKRGSPGAFGVLVGRATTIRGLRRLLTPYIRDADGVRTWGPFRCMARQGLRLYLMDIHAAEAYLDGKPPVNIDPAYG